MISARPLSEHNVRPPNNKCSWLGSALPRSSLQTWFLRLGSVRLIVRSNTSLPKCMGVTRGGHTEPTLQSLGAGDKPPNRCEQSMGKLGGVSLGAMWVGVWMSGGRGGGRAWLAGLLDSWIESDNRGEVAGPLARIPRARIALHEPPHTLPYGDPADVLLFLVADATWQRGGQAATRAWPPGPLGVLLLLCAIRLVRGPRRGPSCGLPPLLG